MTRRLLPLLFASAFAVGAERPPNLVLIVGDDVGYGDLACYGSKINPTPHIDTLAKGGLRFTDFHTGGAMCSPTRASMLTGCYPQRFGADFDGALGKQDDREVGLPLGAVTIAELLKERGYATACFGKWHLGYTAPMIPTRQGFTTFRGMLSGDGDHHTHIDRSGNEDWYADEALDMEEGYTADLLTGYSLDFIGKHRESPFFLYLPFAVPHLSIQAPEDEVAEYTADLPETDYVHKGYLPHPKPHAGYAAMVTHMDRGVGEILALLAELGLDEKTAVFFTSDNGPTYDRLGGSDSDFFE
ncbi:MAG: sulfatase-like hydrolase/transferase, partial [Verrucomicrobiae bacterium]|nr:sulfatase-like hydrolase/transferase [Verrucomicrobiae bacterium]